MKKNKILFPKKVALLLGAAAVLLLGSTVGSTRAALTYYSENYSAQMNLKHIGSVCLVKHRCTLFHNNDIEFCRCILTVCCRERVADIQLRCCCLTCRKDLIVIPETIAAVCPS